MKLTCKHIDFLLIAAVPAVNVLLMLEALRSDWDPSIPTREPLKLEAPIPLAVTNNLLMSSLKHHHKHYDFLRRILTCGSPAVW